jgi:DNA polymerase-3 subunit alpha
MMVNPLSWKKIEKDFLPLECNPFAKNGDLQKAVNQKIVALAKGLGKPLLLTLDSHFVAPDQKMIQDILLQNGNENGWRFFTSYYQMNTEQAWQTWARSYGSDRDSINAFVEGVENNQALVDKVGKIGFEKAFHLPEVDLPIEISSRKDMNLDEKLEEYCLQLIAKEERFPTDDRSPVYAARLKKELDVIVRNPTLNFLPYFLVIYEFCAYAREVDEPIGPGRGSVGGCLLAYLLKIIHVDPIAYDLSFERFLSLGRIARGKFPDIDMDFGNPTAITSWLKQKYGEKFCRISTTNTAKLKGAIRDVSRILLGTKTNPLIAAEVEAVCKTIGIIPQGMSDTKRWLYGYEDSSGNAVPGHISENADLMAFFTKYPQVRASVDGILDVPRALGRHASAYCLSDVPVSDIVPMCRISEEECTQFTMGPVESLGLVKMDFLGLNTLNDIHGALKLIEKRHGLKIDPYQIPTNDEKTYQSFCKGHNETVFQFKSKIGVDLCRKIKPKNIWDLSMITAAGRPGTMYSLMEDGKTTLVDAWVQRRQGRQNPDYVHPSVEPILKDTMGIVIFQEQIMKMFMTCCGFSEERSDEVREIIGKKKHDQMQKLLPEIREELGKRGWTDKQMDSFISLCVAAANYSFNASHSVAYSYVGYVCQYLKTNYSLEWWTSILQNSTLDDLKDNARYCQNIVKRPDINKSELDFYIIDDQFSQIMYPLGMVRGVKNAGKDIVAKKPYASMADFYERVTRGMVDKTVVANLIWAGAFDGVSKITHLVQRNDIYKEYLNLRGIKKEKEAFVALSEVDLMKAQMVAMPLGAPDFADMINTERKNEGKPQFRFSDPAEIINLAPRDRVTVAGIIAEVRMAKTKVKPNGEGGESMAFIEISNKGVEVSVTVFPKSYERFKRLIVKGEICVIEGTVNEYRNLKSLLLETIMLWK